MKVCTKPKFAEATQYLPAREVTDPETGATKWAPAVEIPGVLSPPGARVHTHTAEGTVHVSAGDWVLDDEDGRRVLSDADFQASYDIVPPEASDTEPPEAA